MSGRLALERPGLSVSAPTIYRAINDRRLDPPELRGTAGDIKARLRHKGKRRHRAGGPEERRGKIPGTRSIEDRPAEAGARERLGDWEGNTVVGKGGREFGGRARRTCPSAQRDKPVTRCCGW